MHPSKARGLNVSLYVMAWASLLTPDAGDDHPAVWPACECIHHPRKHAGAQPRADHAQVQEQVCRSKAKKGFVKNVILHTCRAVRARFLQYMYCNTVYFCYWHGCTLTRRRWPESCVSWVKEGRGAPGKASSSMRSATCMAASHSCQAASCREPLARSSRLCKSGNSFCRGRAKSGPGSTAGHRTPAVHSG